jgi:hypothetical protein
MPIEFIRPQGGSDNTVWVVIQDGAGNLVTGLTAGDMTAAYYRPFAASAQTSALSSLSGPDAPHVDGGFVEVDATNAPGLYRLDLPDAAIARGENSVIVTLTSSSSARQYGILHLDPEPSVVQGQVADSNPTASTFETDLTQGLDDFWADSFVLFVSGTLAGAVERVTGYDGTNGALTTAGFPQAPADGDQFIMLNR